MTAPAPADIDILARSIVAITPSPDGDPGKADFTCYGDRNPLDPDNTIERPALFRVIDSGASKGEVLALITAAFEKRQA